MIARRIAESAVADAVLADPADIHVGEEKRGFICKPVGLGNLAAELIDCQLAVPGGVGRGLAIAGGGVDVAA